MRIEVEFVDESVNEIEVNASRSFYKSKIDDICSSISVIIEDGEEVEKTETPEEQVEEKIIDGDNDLVISVTIEEENKKDETEVKAIIDDGITKDDEDVEVYVKQDPKILDNINSSIEEEKEDEEIDIEKAIDEKLNKNKDENDIHSIMENNFLEGKAKKDNKKEDRKNNNSILD